MATRDIKFSEFEPRVQQTLTQALKLAASMAEQHSVIFSIYGARIRPTAIEIAHTVELLQTVIMDRTIWYGADFYVAAALQFIVEHIEDSLDKGLPEEDALKQYGLKYDIDMDSDILMLLKCLAKQLNPVANLTNEISIHGNMPIDSKMQKFARALRTSIANGDSTKFNYGQNDITIIVDGVAYKINSNHKIIWELNKFLNCAEAQQ